MKHGLLFIMLLCCSLLTAQETRPSYCDEMPVSYDQVTPKGGSPRPKLPKFQTKAVSEYKVQVAILKFTNPEDFPFHSKLIARYRPCEEVWVVESRDMYRSRAEAERLQRELRNLGYNGAYVVEMIGYQ